MTVFSQLFWPFCSCVAGTRLQWCLRSSQGERGILSRSHPGAFAVGRSRSRCVRDVLRLTPLQPKPGGAVPRPALPDGACRSLRRADKWRVRVSASGRPRPSSRGARVPAALRLPPAKAVRCVMRSLLFALLEAEAPRWAFQEILRACRASRSQRTAPSGGPSSSSRLAEAGRGGLSGTGLGFQYRFLRQTIAPGLRQR